MVEDQEQQNPETEDGDAEVWATIEDTRQQLAMAYLNFLDKQKWGMLATGAWLGVNVNPLQQEAIAYLTTNEDKERKGLFATLGKNIKKKIIEQVSGWTVLEYNKASLAKMKGLITQYKDDQAKLQGLMAQIQAGTDPTNETPQTPNSPVAVVAWVWIGAVAAETSFEETEIKRNDYVYPVPNAKINSSIGMRTIEGMWTHMHKGIDIADTEGTSIVSIADGKVESVWFGSATAWFSGYGNYMVVKLKNGYRVLYGHMQKYAQKTNGIERKKWDTIKKSEQIWLMGSTWMSTGSHLHLEIRKGKFENDDTDYFAREYLDPIAVLPVKKDMVAANILHHIDEKVLMA